MGLFWTEICWTLNRQGHSGAAILQVTKSASTEPVSCKYHWRVTSLLRSLQLVYVFTSFLKMAPRVLKLCFAFVRAIPVVFITAVIGWSYYAFVVQMCICTYNVLLRIICCIFLSDFWRFLTNVLRYVRYMLSAVRLLSVVCLSVCLSVTLVHFTQAVELFGNFFHHTIAIHTFLFRRTFNQV